MSAAMTARSTSHTEGVDRVRALQRVLYRSAKQHPERGGLACAIGAENPVNRALRHRNVPAVHRARAVKAFDQPARFDSKGARIKGKRGGTGLEIARQCVIAYRHIHRLNRLAVRIKREPFRIWLMPRQHLTLPRE